MRILKRNEAIGIDIDFIYKRGDAIAIVTKEFDKRFDIKPKE